MEPVHCCLQGRHNRKPSRYSTNMEVLVKVLKKGLLYSCRLKMYCRQRGNTRAASGQERKYAIQVLPKTLYTEFNAILSAAKAAHDNTILVYFNFIIMYNDSIHLYTRLRIYRSYIFLSYLHYGRYVHPLPVCHSDYFKFSLFILGISISPQTVKVVKVAERPLESGFGLGFFQEGGFSWPW